MTSIVTVCTGNICRSPAAELLLARALGEGAEVSSAGTHAMVGHGIPALMLECLDREGIDGRGHSARQFSSSMAADTDLILCMTAQHRLDCLRVAPFALKRTFLLAEVAAAARARVPLEGGAAGIAAAVSAHRVQLAGEPMEDVPDPYGGSRADYEESYELIAEMIATIEGWVAAEGAA